MRMSANALQRGVEKSANDHMPSRMKTIEKRDPLDDRIRPERQHQVLTRTTSAQQAKPEDNCSIIEQENTRSIRKTTQAMYT